MYVIEIVLFVRMSGYTYRIYGEEWKKYITELLFECIRFFSCYQTIA